MGIRYKHHAVPSVEIEDLFASEDEVKALIDIATNPGVDDWQLGRQASSIYFKTDVGERWLSDCGLSREARAFKDVRNRLLHWVDPDNKRLGDDHWFIYYPPLNGVAPHKDEGARNHIHVRANLILRRGGPAGLHIGGYYVPLETGSAVRFASSELVHEVTAGHSGRLVFSVGALLPNRKEQP